ncbi:type III effector protein [Streptomyces purpureus]|uniref:type III effector protein n=1 Tax=Streptomyces purpureus TaxID=1951 RepID=UPI00379A507F
MTADNRPQGPGPASVLAAAAALGKIGDALRGAQKPEAEPDGPTRAEEALATLLLLRRIREELAGWESGLIEVARDAGASWADLAAPLGVASRQAAERRYLRLRPGDGGATGEERVKATRDRRAADRSVTAWARHNAADLRRLAGQITALSDLPDAADLPLDTLLDALAHDDAARLVGPLADAGPHLRPDHADLADRVDALTRHADRLRQDSDDRRRTDG